LHILVTGHLANGVLLGRRFEAYKSVCHNAICTFVNYCHGYVIVMLRNLRFSSSQNSMSCLQSWLVEIFSFTKVFIYDSLTLLGSSSPLRQRLLDGKSLSANLSVHSQNINIVDGYLRFQVVFDARRKQTIELFQI